MKNQLLKIVSFLLLVACNKVDYIPKIKDFANAWERDNLIGKVKTLDEYNAAILDSKMGKTEKPVIVIKKEYTDFGEIASQEQYDTFGKVQMIIKNEFNTNGIRTKSITENIIDSTKSIEIFELNSIGKPVLNKVFLNGKLNSVSFFDYDNHGNVIYHKIIQESDTTSMRVEFNYSESGKIDKEIISFDGEIGKQLNFKKYAYDQNENLIEVITFTESLEEMKSTFEYDQKNRIQKSTQFKANEIQQESTFDTFYNKTLVKTYVNKSLKYELKYDYKFDRKGNWTERKTFAKQDSESNKIWIPTKVDTRILEYYE